MQCTERGDGCSLQVKTPVDHPSPVATALVPKSPVRHRSGVDFKCQFKPPVKGLNPLNRLDAIFV
jgi:hypothetical protein